MTPLAQPRPARSSRWIATVLLLAVAVRAEAAANDRAATEAWRRSIASLRQALAAAPRDAAALARLLGPDPAAAFTFVRDEIALDPYTGVLRGPAGTLRARAGNAWDRALLLAELLRAQGREVRLARGTPDAAVIDQLLRRAAAAPPRADLGGASKSLLAALARLSGVDPGSPVWAERLRATQPGRQAARAAVEASFRATYGTDLGVLTRALATPPVAVASTAATDLAAARAALADHVWVEMKEAGAWVPLDPSLPEAAPGKALATARETLASVPEAQYHRVSVRLEIERRRQGTLLSEVLVAASGHAAELAAGPLVLSFRARAKGGALTGALAGPEPYLPVLVVGAARREGKPVTFADVAGGGGGGGGPLDALSGAVATEVVALRLRIEIARPGAPPTVVIRALFDRLPADPRARASAPLAPMPMAGAAPAVCSTTVSLAVTTGSIDPLLLLDDQLRLLDTALAGPGAGDDAEDVAHAERVHIMNLGFHALRDALAGWVLPAGARELAPAPRITTLLGSAGDVSGADGKAARLSWTFDVTSYPGRVLAGADAPADLGYRLGALDHAAEHLYMQRAVAGARCPDCEPPAANGVATVFAAAAGVVVLDPRKPAELDALAAPPDARARMRAALASGLLVVAPARPVSGGGYGYWKVDPRDGRAQDELDSGWHEESVEYNTPRTMAARTTAFWARHGSCVIMIAITAAAATAYVAAVVTFRGDEDSGLIYGKFIGGAVAGLVGVGAGAIAYQVCTRSPYWVQPDALPPVGGGAPAPPPIDPFAVTLPP